MARKNRESWADETDGEIPVATCWLCGRDMGSLTEWHHPIPKSRGGRERQPVHPICHRTIHLHFTNSELEKRYSTVDALLNHSEIARFVQWVAGKPADFDAPTKGKR
jgi:hypothetical protein